MPRGRRTKRFQRVNKANGLNPQGGTFETETPEQQIQTMCGNVAKEEDIEDVIRSTRTIKPYEKIIGWYLEPQLKRLTLNIVGSKNREYTKTIEFNKLHPEIKIFIENLIITSC